MKFIRFAPLALICLLLAAASAKQHFDAYAIKANAEGYKSVAGLFRAGAVSAVLQMKNHENTLNKMGAKPEPDTESTEVKSTSENLQDIVEEEQGKDNVYLALTKFVDEHKSAEAVKSFELLGRVEAEHAKLFAVALENLEDWKTPGKAFLICPKAGYITMDRAIKNCPLCGADRSEFLEVQ